MMRYRWLLALCLGLCVVLVPRVSGADDDDESRSDIDIVWYTVDGGGGFSRNDDILIGGTVGQFDAGICRIDEILLICGFWDQPLRLGCEGDRVLASVAEAVGSAAAVQARVVNGAIEIHLEHEFLAGLTEIALERAATDQGPWDRVPFEQRSEGSGRLLVVPKAAGDQSWYYRVQVSEPGVAMRTFGPTLVTMDSPIRELSLAPISPNPSRGGAEVSWTVPHESRVRLTVHDVQGRQVAVLADGVYKAGRYGSRWSSTRAVGGPAPGVYFLRLQSPDGVQVRRFVLAY